MMGMSRRTSAKVAFALVFAAILITVPDGQGALAQSWRPPRGGQVTVPDSSVEQSPDIGVRVHTNVRVFAPTGVVGGMHPPSPGVGPEQAPVAGDYWAETPASLACVYNLVAQSNNCNPYSVSTVPTGGSRAIAIVDAYHYPTAMSDLTRFSTQFELPLPTSCTLQVVYASGSQPSTNSSWNLEAALDIEWAHAMAPDARIYLVEARSSSVSDMLAAVAKANALLTNPPTCGGSAPASGGQVSMSWGSSEFASQVNYESYFTAPGVVYFAAAGDHPGVMWPSASPNVVSVGGTANSRVASGPQAGDFQGQLAWQSTGGGSSAYENPPAYQTAWSPAPSRRLTPDVAAVADPNTPVYVYRNGRWYLVGGTSVATPVWAGIVNQAGRFASSSQEEQSWIAGLTGLRNVTSGACGPHLSYWVDPSLSYDLCTGLGTPNGLDGK